MNPTALQVENHCCVGVSFVFKVPDARRRLGTQRHREIADAKVAVVGAAQRCDAYHSYLIPVSALLRADSFAL